MRKPARDNSTLNLKTSLRRNVLTELGAPAVVCETHGGYGHIYERCYRAAAGGVVFEKDAAKAEFLARQRPAWAVYECDSTAALAAGVGGHLPINLLDLDPYGEPWPVLDAFLAGHGERLPDVWGLAANDGLRQVAANGKAWQTHSLQEAVQVWGSSQMHARYLEVCRWMVEQKAGRLGFKLARWAGYYCGAGQGMTHYAAILVRA